MGSNSKLNILKSSLIYTFFKYVTLAISAIRGIFMAKFLGPTLLGSYSLIMLTVNYSKYGNFGIFSAMNLEVSVNLDKKNSEPYIREVINATVLFIGILLLGFICLGILASSSLFTWISSDIQSYVWAIIFLCISLQLKSFLLTYFRLYNQFSFINALEVLSTLILFFGVVFFAKSFTLNAVMISACVAGIVSVFFFIIFFVQFKPSLRLNWKSISSLLSVGLPLLIYGLSDYLFTTLDRLVIATYFSREYLGYYAFGSTLAINALIVTDSFGYLFYPKFLRKFHKDAFADSEDYFETLLKYTFWLETINVGLILVGIIAVRYVIQWWLPQFSVSIFVTQILLLTFAFKGLSYFVSIYLVSNRYQKEIVGILFILMPIAFSLMWLGIRLGAGFEGVILVNLVAFFLYNAVLTALMLVKSSLFSVFHLVRFYIRYIPFMGITLFILFWNQNWIFISIPLFFIMYYSGIRQLVQQFKVRIIQ